MNTTKKILLTHIIIQTVYILISNALRDGQSGGGQGLGVAMLLMFLLSVHCAFALMISVVYFISGKKEPAKAHLLSAVFILVVGVPACFASAAL